MNWLQLAGSIAAVVILTGLIWKLRLGSKRVEAVIESPEAALKAVEQTLAGFGPIGSLVGENRCAALVAGAHGRVAVVKQRGARLAVREVRWEQVRATHEGLMVETGDRRFGVVSIQGINVLDVRRLAPSLTSV